jgi:hypothetical protein
MFGHNLKPYEALGYPFFFGALVVVILLCIPVWCLGFIVGFMAYQPKPVYHWVELN